MPAPSLYRTKGFEAQRSQVTHSRSCSGSEAEPSLEPECLVFLAMRLWPTHSRVLLGMGEPVWLEPVNPLVIRACSFNALFSGSQNYITRELLSIITGAISTLFIFRSKMV